MSDLHIEQPIEAVLLGGPLDGDSFSMSPNGSIMPPTQLRYPSESPVGDGIWLVYQADNVALWDQARIEYRYVGYERIMG